MIFSLLISSVVATPFNCKAAWSDMAAANPVGRILEYEHIEQKDGVSTTSIKKVQVIEASPDEIIVRTNRGDETEEESHSKEDWVESCEKPDLSAYSPSSLFFDPEIELVEKRSEALTVRAGSFSADYMKFRLSLRMLWISVEGTIELWLNVADRLHPLKVSADMATPDGRYKMQIKEELVTVKKASPKKVAN